jgi:hypothetical protein
VTIIVIIIEMVIIIIIIIVIIRTIIERINAYKLLVRGDDSGLKAVVRGRDAVLDARLYV